MTWENYVKRRPPISWGTKNGMYNFFTHYNGTWRISSNICTCVGPNPSHFNPFYFLRANIPKIWFNIIILSLLSFQVVIFWQVFFSKIFCVFFPSSRALHNVPELLADTILILTTAVNTKRSPKTLLREYWLSRQLLHLESPCMGDTSFCFIITVAVATEMLVEKHLLPTLRMVPVSTLVASPQLKTQQRLLILWTQISKSVEF